jgi:predicted phosphate transport protein (TIGR00153 family)
MGMKLTLIPQGGRRFYDLFRKQGELVSETLSELSKSLLEGKSRHARLRDLEHECDEATHQIHNLVNNTFVTPIDQEDILLLASSLDDIVDLAEETGDKIDLYQIQAISDAAKAMGEHLAKAGVEIGRALERLEGFKELKPHRLEIHRLENEGDRITREAIGDLFSTVSEASELVKWKDVYDLLEATMDACEHAANVMETISIKNA